MAGFWRKCRITFRWLRITIWLLVLILLGAFLWCNRVGLPDFLKSPLVAALRERGVELEFSRMRFSLTRGIVADEVRAGETTAKTGASFSARLVELELDFPAFLHRKLALNGLLLRDGVFTLPVSPTNSLQLTNLHATLRFGVHDTWSLDELSANFAGAQIKIVGEMSHARQVLEWKLFRTGGTAEPGAGSGSLKTFSDALAQIHFLSTPQLRLKLTGDGRDLHSIAMNLDAAAAGVKTPWFTATNFQAAFQLTAPAETSTNHDAGWGFWTDLQPFRLAWSAQLGGLRTKELNLAAVNCSGLWNSPVVTVSNVSARLGGGGLNADLTLDVPTRRMEFRYSSTFSPPAIANLLPEIARAELAKVTWGKPPHLKLEGSLLAPSWTNLTAAYDPALDITGTLACTNPTVAGVKLDRLQTLAHYQQPFLEVSNLTVVQGRTDLRLAGKVDEARRDYQVQASGAFDAACLRPFFTNTATRGLAQLTAAKPLNFSLSATGNLNHQETMSVTGRVAVGQTDLHLNGRLNEATRDWQMLASGAFDLNSIRAFLINSNAVHGFSYLTFNDPLRFSLAAAGNLKQWETLSATGQVALTNFAIRHQTLDSLFTHLSYSNRLAVFSRPEATRAGGEQYFSADNITLDLARPRLFFNSGYGRVEPMAVGRAIGPVTAAAMAPYQFLSIPTTHVNGCVPLQFDAHNELILDDADLRFDPVGTLPFRWRKFETPAIGGTIRWWKNFLMLTNITAECYTGNATGWGSFDLKTPGAGTDFSFFIQATNVDLHQMGTALWSRTNHLEGALSGDVFVTEANSADWRTWNGLGDVQLRDGLLWDVPMFAFMSPMLNTVSPGLGNSRATQAAAQFIMTNGVITSDSLVIHAQSMRLEYVGTVDLQENVNAKVTARLLRNMPVLGSVLSFVLTPVSKIFECRVTGTLSDPKVSPVYIPKILLVPFHPIRSLEELLTSPSAATNSPPVK